MTNTQHFVSWGMALLLMVMIVILVVTLQSGQLHWSALSVFAGVLVYRKREQMLGSEPDDE